MIKIEVCGEKIRLTHIIFGLIIISLLACHTLFSCSDFSRAVLDSLKSNKEGFTVEVGNGVRPENSFVDYSKKPVANTNVQVPPEELHFFANNEFNPDCCPSSYTSSTGCACMTPEQLNYLNNRGGNRTSSENK
tara:strand:- start:241 stop:642 length:402 start_codon:yes stop_codon:yes gene_type:complete